MTIGLDTEKINASSTQIIGNLQEESLAVYCFLHEQWEGQSAVDNKIFQFVFRSFYRLDNAGLTDEFKEKYFERLEASRSRQPNIKSICMDLYGVRNRKGSESLQFSFVTKLANTVNASLPIYDSEVAKMYGYRAPLSGKPVDERVDHLLRFYSELSADYERIISDGSLDEIFQLFDKVFPRYANTISQNKKLDFIIWSAGKLIGK